MADHDRKPQGSRTKKRPRSESRAASSEASDPFAPGALEPEEHAARFAAAAPYTHVQLHSLFDEGTLLRVRQELGLLQSTFKETDLFKVRACRGPTTHPPIHNHTTHNPRNTTTHQPYCDWLLW